MWPISLNVSHNKPKVKRFSSTFLIIWSVTNILSISAYIVLICVYNELVLREIKGVGEFSAVSKGGTVIMTHLIILLESLYTRAGQEFIWSKATSVDRTFEKMGISTAVHNSKFHRKYFWKFLSYQFLAWISETSVLCLVQDNVSWMLFNYATLYSVMVSRSRHLYQAFYIGEF